MLNLKNKKGAISVLLAVLVLTAVLVIALGLSGIMLREIGMSGQASYSIKAYQAADTGIEWALDRVKQEAAIPESKICDNWTSVGDSAYCLEITAGTKQDPEGIKSIGKAGQVRRAVEIGLIEEE